MKKTLPFSFVVFFFLLSYSLSAHPDNPLLFPRIGVAKSVSAPVHQANGSYNFTYTVTVKNYGDETLHNVQVTDALSLEFLPPAVYTLVGNVVATGSLVANTAFNGSSNINLLASGSLTQSETQTIVYTLNVNGALGPFLTTVLASGTGNLLVVTDLSVNGNNPDPNGDGSPIETSLTSVSLLPIPVIGLSKSAASPLAQANGSYNITYTITIKNYGNEILNSIQVADAVNLAILAPATFSLVGLPVASGGLAVNPAFNGSGVTNLLAAGNTLAVGVTQTVTFTINVVTHGLFGPFLNSATASGTGATSTLVTNDISVAGNNPDPDGDGLPIELLPTSTTLVPTPVIGVAKSASVPAIQPDGSYNVLYTLTLENLGNEMLTNVQVTDVLIAVVIPPASYTVVGDPVASGTLVAKPGYNGNSVNNLLSSGSTLAVGATQTIHFTINVKSNGIFGPFTNTAIASASGSLIQTTDISVDGNDPDPNGDGIPLEVSPTLVTLIPVPIIGVAKSATMSPTQLDGSAIATFKVTLKNYGNEELKNVQVTDILASIFVSPSVYEIVGNVIGSGTLVANAGFNGDLISTLLAPGSTLPIGATQTISFAVKIHPGTLLGPFINTAIASATGSLLPTVDISVNGNDPDPNGDGFPLETLPTTFGILPLPVIGIAKSASSPQLQANGSYNVTFTITLENLGNENLSNVQVTDALISTFAAPSAYSLVGNVITSGTLIANAGFNGNVTTGLLATGSTLAIGTSQTITFTVNVSANSVFGPFLNTAIATATGSLLPTTDISVDGNNPDPNGDGIPLETSPTIVSLIPVPLIGIAKSASSPLVQPNGSYNVTYTFTLENFGNENLNNVQVTDGLISIFASPSVYNLVGGVIASGTLHANAGFNGNTVSTLLAAGSTLAVGATQTISFTLNVKPNTLFGPFLNTAVASASGSLLQTVDVSVNGNDPDPGGDGIPLETSPTIVALVPVPLIGIAKSASSPLAQPDHTYNITYKLTLENLGNEPLTNVQATDALVSAFIAPSVYSIVGNVVTSGSLIANVGFDGNVTSNLLASGSTLAVGATQTITFTINVDPHSFFGPFLNTAVASATGSLLPTVDVSVDGNDPDPNGDGLPLETLPTIVSLVPVPIIGVAKNITSTILQSDGSYNLTYSVLLKNYGNVELQNILVTDDLSQAFGLSAGFSLVGNVSANGGLDANLSFDGFLNANLLNGLTSSIPIGGSQTLNYTVNVKPNGLFGPFCNSAIASATGPAGVGLTIDISQSGSNPDPNGNGNPNESNENICTPITLTPNPVFGIAKSASIPVLQADGSYNVQYVITVKNMGNSALATVQVSDDLSTAFAAPVTFSIQGTPSVTGTLLANNGFNGSSNKNLLAAASTLAIGSSATVSFNVNIVPHGNFGPFFNSATGSGLGGAISATDISTDGTNPDPNGNGNPGDINEAIATSITLSPNPIIGLAKSFSPPLLQNDGSYNTTMIFTVTNMGNINLENVQVTDNLLSAFPTPSTYSIVGAVTAPITLVGNASYDGNTDDNLLGAGSTLSIGATEHITVNINIDPHGSFGPFFNTSTATAKGLNVSTTTSDISTDGNNPDPNGNHNPNDSNESIASSISLSPNPIIGLAKNAGTPQLQSNGSYTIPFTITVKNMGNVTLQNVQVTDDLSSAFNSPTTYTLVGNAVATGTLSANASFNGSTDTNLLAAASTLLAGQSQTITFAVNVLVNGNFGPFSNSAQAAGTGIGGVGNPTDISDDGTNPDPNGNGNPGDPGENDATTITLTPNPVIGVAKAVGTPTVLPDGTYRISYTITVKNIGNVNFSGVQVMDNLSSAFPSPATFALTGNVIVSGTMTANSSFNGSTVTNLLATGSVLAAGDQQTISYQVIVTPNGSFGPFYNSAVVNGTSASGNFSDLSASGYNPDPNGNGNPGDPGENDATSITLTPSPILGVAKAAGQPTLQAADGSYHVTYTVTLENLGNIALTNVQVTDDLVQAITAPATFSLIGNVTATGTLSASSTYNGDTDTHLLSGGTIAIGATNVIVFTISIQPNGNLGPFYNSAIGTGQGGTITYTDISTSGTNPDPNGNRRPDDVGEDTSTGVTLAARIVGGLADAVSLPILQPDGSYRATYTLTVKNMGNVDLNKIQVTDNLSAAFPAPVTFTVVPGSIATTGQLIANNSFDGVSDVNLLSTNSKIPIGVSSKITFIISILLHGNSGVYNSSASVTSISDDGLTVYNDISDNGTDPDPNGNGDPGDIGENDPTPLTLTPKPVIGVAMSAALPIQQTDGTFNVAYTITLKNYGNVRLLDAQVKDNLALAFPNPLTYTVTNITSPSAWLVNTGFNGKTDTNLLPLGNSLSVGESALINFTVNINANGQAGPFYNSAVASATGFGSSGASSDLSTSGNDPDPNNNGNPSDPGEDQATGITLGLSPVIGIAKATGTPIKNSDNSFDIPITLTIENLGNTMLNNISVLDNLSTSLPAPLSVSIKSNSSTSGALVANTSYNGKTQLNLLQSSSSLAIGAKETIKFTINVAAPVTGTYYNSASASATNPANTISYTDLSTNGVISDLNGNKNPGDANESQVTPISFDLVPVIDLTHNISSAILKPDGTYDVTFLLTAENLGNEDLINVKIKNDLAYSFPAPMVFKIATKPAATGTLIANANFNGQSVTDLLTGGSLKVGEKQTVQYAINVTPENLFGVFWNSASTSATGTQSNRVASDTELESTSLIPNQVIGIAKKSGDIIPQGSCVYDVPFTIVIENLGNADLTNLVLTDDITKCITNGATYSVVSLTASDGIKANTAYNGSSDINLITSGNTIKQGGKAEVNFTIRVTPNQYYGPFKNVSVGNGEGWAGKVSDNSVSGTTSDPNQNKNPDEEGPTEFSIIPVDLFIPQGFSPNGDGAHDYFEVTLNCGLTVNLFVYNRWGDLVFNGENYQNDWDGRSNHGAAFGKSLPDGTYFYTAKLSNGNNLTSFITIKR